MPKFLGIPKDAPPIVQGAELARWVGVGRGTIADWVRAGVLPKPIRHGPRNIYFTLEQVREFIRRRFGVTDQAACVEAPKTAKQRA